MIWVYILQKKTYTRIQQIYEKMLDITNNQENENKNYYEISPHTCYNVIKKDEKCW
jgi:hypothetical protein